MDRAVSIHDGAMRPFLLVVPRDSVEGVGQGLHSRGGCGRGQSDFSCYTYDRELGVWRVLLAEADLQCSESDCDAEPVEKHAGHLIGVDVGAGSVAHNFWQSFLRLFHRPSSPR